MQTKPKCKTLKLQQMNYTALNCQAKRSKLIHKITIFILDPYIYNGPDVFHLLTIQHNIYTQFTSLVGKVCSHLKEKNRYITSQNL